MSTLWTPEGERPIRRDPPASSPPPASGGPSRPPGDDDEPTEAEMRAEMEQLREQLARTPAEVVVANHAFGLFELAALHLSLQPPQLEQARLAIDALAALVDALGTRLEDAGVQLAEGLSQLRLAYVQIHAAEQARSGGGGTPAAGAPAAGEAEAGESDGGEPEPA
jgi:hypothetical protein